MQECYFPPAQSVSSNLVLGIIINAAADKLKMHIIAATQIKTKHDK